MLLLIGLVQAEMAEKGLVWVMGRGFVPKETVKQEIKFVDYKPLIKRERKYKK